MTPLAKILLVVLIACVGVWAYFERQRDAATPLAIRTPSGQEHRLADLHGKVVLVDFWATWCGPCRMSIPAIQALYAKNHGRGFEVLGVALENDSGENIPAFAQAMGITYPVGLPVSREETAEYRPDSLPCMVLIDKRGNIRWRQVGYAPEIEAILKARVEGLLKE